ncbi:MAG TPA: hypothetical protein VE263_16515 [Candidatus Angelobacter sp.]|nr:hypothetical protein [Candidatus Angelobacter sp.]
MNRAIVIIFLPALLVAAGYVLVLRYFGFAPGYLRLLVVVTLFFGATYWLSRKSGHKPNMEQK